MVRHYIERAIKWCTIIYSALLYGAPGHCNAASSTRGPAGLREARLLLQVRRSRGQKRRVRLEARAPRY